VRALVERHLALLQRKRLVSGYELAPYEPETARYGGEEGVALAERIFFHDTVACLDLMEAERNGLTGRSRREFSLLFTDRFLDLMRFDRSRKLACYAFGHRWAIEDGTWKDEDLRILDERYRAIRPGLAELFSGRTTLEPDEIWGGRAPEAIAKQCLEASRPIVEEVLEGIAAGRIRQDPIALAWSYTHMHCNRLGIDPIPEAILRYFMHRHLSEAESP
jgi:thiopeptide-type bacteriocin biosynthesis protein